jgi:hypothetical protein
MKGLRAKTSPVFRQFTLNGIQRFQRYLRSRRVWAERVRQPTVITWRPTKAFTDRRARDSTFISLADRRRLQRSASDELRIIVDRSIEVHV